MSSDLADSAALLIALHQIAPPGNDRSDRSDGTTALRALRVHNRRQRASLMLRAAREVGVEMFELEPDDVVEAARRPRPMRAFVAALLHTCPNLQPSGDAGDELRKLRHEDDDREERAFRAWLSSLGFALAPGPVADCCRDDTCLLLRLADELQPGCVDWRRAHTKPTVGGKPLHVSRRLENCNYAVEVLQMRFKIQVAGIGGEVRTANTPLRVTRIHASERARARARTHTHTHTGTSPLPPRSLRVHLVCTSPHLRTFSTARQSSSRRFWAS